jgi:arylsulfatase A-like enzyme
MGKRLDDAMGKIMTTLKSEGIWENTLLFFISDNGGPLAQNADNTPLRGGKHTDYEGGIRVPFLVCWPAQLKPGEHLSPVISLDILPTALAAAGVTADQSFDGQNILPLLRGDTTPPSRDLFWCSGSDEGWWAVRSGDWKLVGEKGNLSLFDLSKDVSESTNLAAQMPDKVAELTKRHDTWLADMAKPVKADEKRYDMAVKEETTPKKSKKMTKEEKQKARDMERAKKRQSDSPNTTPEAPKA